MSRRRESPVKRTTSKGKTRWLARYTGPDGKRRSAGTYDTKKAAQDAIDRAYGRPTRLDTVGAYASTWTRRHPRSDRTNRTNEHRLSRVLDVRVQGIALRDWPLTEVRRAHTVDLVEHLLTVDGRAVTGTRNILRTLSAMFEDAIGEELCELNPWQIRVRANDPRIRKQPREPRVWTLEDSYRLAAAAATTTRWHSGKTAGPRLREWRGVYAEAMIRCLSDCGLRLGELLGLERRDFTGDTIMVRGTSHNGVFIEGDQPTKKHVREVPVPPTLAGMLRALPPRIDTRVLFPTPSGRVWWERNFYRDVWGPAREASGVAATPHELRHSWVTMLRAAGVDPADLADAAGHTVETATARYTHALRASDDQIRKAIG